MNAAQSVIKQVYRHSHMGFMIVSEGTLRFIIAEGLLDLILKNRYKKDEINIKNDLLK